MLGCSSLSTALLVNVFLLVPSKVTIFIGFPGHLDIVLASGDAQCTILLVFESGGLKRYHLGIGSQADPCILFFGSFFEWDSLS